MSSKAGVQELVKQPLLGARVTFPIKRMAAAMCVTEEKMREGMRDGRGAWPFSEHWGLLYIKYLDSIGRPIGGQRGVDTFALTRNGVQFLRSKNHGSQRSGNIDDLIEHIESCRLIVMVDVTEFPDVVFTPVYPHKLIETVHAGKLGVSGWATSSFYKWVRENYAYAVKKAPLSRLTAPNKVHAA